MSSGPLLLTWALISFHVLMINCRIKPFFMQCKCLLILFTKDLLLNLKCRQQAGNDTFIVSAWHQMICVALKGILLHVIARGTHISLLVRAVTSEPPFLCLPTMNLSLA